MEERAEDLFEPESPLPASASQELRLSGPRVQPATLPDPLAVPLRHRSGHYVRHSVRRLPRHVMAIGLLLVAGFIGVVSSAWMLRPRQDTAPPPVANFVPPPLPPEPAPTLPATPPVKTSVPPAAPLPAAKKPVVTPATSSAARPPRMFAPPAIRTEAQTPPAPQPPPASPRHEAPPRPAPPPTVAQLPVAAPSSSLPPPPAAERPAEIKEEVVVTADRRGVEAAVGRYRDGFTNLDAAAVHAVWPAANERQLARAFSQLQDQRLEFHACDFDVKESVAAATCTGVAAYVPKIGNKDPRFDDRRWVFSLKRAGTGWLIQDVVIR